MSKDKRLIIICLLTSIVIQVGIPKVSATAADNTQVRIEPMDLVVGPSETFTIQVVIEGANDLGAFQFELTYDPAILQVTEAALGDFLGSTGRSGVPVGPEVDNQKGRVKLGAISFGSAAGPSGSGVLATITCVAQGEGSTVLRLLDVQVLNTEANAQSVTVQNGQVVARGAATPTPIPTATPSAVTPKPTNTPVAEDTPTPAATALLSPTPMATSTAVETPTKSLPSSPTPSTTSVVVETPTEAPAPSPTPSPSMVPTETRLAETATPSTVPTVEATQTPVHVTIAPTFTPSTSPSPPSPSSTPSPTPMPSPTPFATLTSRTAEGSSSWILLVGLSAALGLAILAVLILSRRPAG